MRGAVVDRGLLFGEGEAGFAYFHSHGVAYHFYVVEFVNHADLFFNRGFDLRFDV